jgi:quercetin dioxygenase-like cupin family protein
MRLSPTGHLVSGRQIVLGVDDHGRSKVERIDAIDETSFHQGSWILEYLDVELDVVAAAQPSSAPKVDLRVGRGSVAWRFLNYAAGQEYPLHYSSTVDLQMLVAGDAELILETDSVKVAAGDTVAITGQVHGWRAGEHGCRLAVVVVGA